MICDIARAKTTDRLNLECEPTTHGLLQTLAETGNLTYTTVMQITSTLEMQLRITA